MSVRTLPPTQSKLSRASRKATILYLPLSAVYEVGDKALLWDVNHGEPRCMEAFQAAFQNKSQLSILLLTCLVKGYHF